MAAGRGKHERERKAEERTEEEEVWVARRTSSARADIEKRLARAELEGFEGNGINGGRGQVQEPVAQRHVDVRTAQVHSMVTAAVLLGGLDEQGTIGALKRMDDQRVAECPLHLELPH